MIKLAFKQTLLVITLFQSIIFIYLEITVFSLFSERKQCFFMISCELLSYQASNIFHI